MRIIMWAVVIAWLPSGIAAQQKGFEIKGKIGNWNTPAKAYLIYSKDKVIQITDSSKIVNGVFSFRGSITEPYPGTLVLDHSGIGLAQLNESNADYLAFYIANESMLVSSKDSMKKATVTGSAINKELARYNAFVYKYALRSSSLQAELANAPLEKQKDSAFQREMREKMEVAREEGAACLKVFIKQNPSSYFSLVALSNLVTAKVNAGIIDSLSGAISPALHETEQGKALEKDMVILRTTAIGAIAPGFIQSDENGSKIDLADFKGRYVLLDFWASWCLPCRAENIDVVKNYKEYHPKGFEILGISLDDENARAAWLAAIKHDGLTWAQVSDLKGWSNEAAVLYGVQSIPQNFLIDPEGKIIATGLRGKQLGDKLKELFKE